MLGGLVYPAIAVPLVLLPVYYHRVSTSNKARVDAVRAENAMVSLSGKTAVIVGGTSGIGRGLAVRLAKAGASVTIVGRSPTRGAEIVNEMNQVAGTSSSSGSHSFLACNCFSLAKVNECVSTLKDKHESIDYLVCSQGMATIQGWTATSEEEQLDQKLTLHVYSRAAFARGLGEVLQRSGDGKFMSVLSAGVHSAYADYATDPELNRGAYSIKNAADAAGFYNDIMVDSYSQRFQGTTFLHVAPGFVATNWGTEMPQLIRWLVRGMQALAGRTLEDNGEYMMRALTHPSHSVHSEDGRRFYLVDQYGVATAKVTALHDTAMQSVFKSIEAVLDAGRSAVPKL